MIRPPLMVDVDYPVPADQDDDRFQWLFNYWCARRTNGKLPSRDDFDPVDFPHLLGRIVLLDVIREQHDSPRYKVRLWGSILRRIFDKDDTGRWLEDTLRPGTTEAVHSVLNTCAESKRPHFWRRPIPNLEEGVIATRRLLLPLASDGETVDMMMGLLIEELGDAYYEALDPRKEAKQSTTAT